MARSWLYLAGFLLFLPSARAHAQTPESIPPPVSTLQVTSQLVLVPTTVEMRKTGIIYGLKAKQFVVEDNGVAQTVRLDEAVEEQPLSLVIAVQCSRDAAFELTKMTGLQTMISAVTGGGKAEVAVLQFGTRPELLTNFTRDETRRDAALGAIEPCPEEGGAAIFDAVSFANGLFEAHKADGRRAILLISETRDHGSQARPQNVIRDLGRSNTVLDAVAFSPGRDEVVEDLKHSDGANGGLVGLILMAVQAVRNNAPKEFAQQSGGEYINFASQQSFDKSLGTLANHVHNYYLLSFRPTFPDGAAADGLHELTVRVPEYPEASVRHRESYWAGTPAK